MNRISKSFVVERSTDGSAFITAGVVEGKNLGNYYFIDDHLPSKNILYYRLKMVDKDGKFSYSKTIIIRISSNLNAAVVYPNPTAGSLGITLQKQLQHTSTLDIVDLAGRILITKTLASGTSQFSLNVSGLSSGRYFIRIRNSSESINESFLIMK